ncbi:MAG: hypothetical protein WBL88_12395 [Nitrososphaeraceae archaeon]
MEWDEIELLLPSEKPNNTIGRPLNPFGKVRMEDDDGSSYLLFKIISNFSHFLHWLSFWILNTTFHWIVNA